MKRRDILKIAPLAAAGAVSLGKGRDLLSPFTGSDAGRRPAVAPTPEPFGVSTAEVRPHNGSPALFLDGKPVFPAINWVSGPAPDKWDFEEQAKGSAGTGIHIYAFDVGKGTEWVGPGRGRDGDLDFSTVEARFNRVIKADQIGRAHV